ncbi:nicotinamide mononucleotide adenylyltransferase family protein [Syntrophotalea carbinolica DSM 2380]|uniref:Nicotinamide mononucleotide adenylyltransferase family protein n=1 Tax=Syntrophotalea carbinolica (strain DSM 2380 / NBRC 103641 / GraBd1) TaxID=338963 RepID=Q3A6C5_SYNC1|nr:nicotinamide mononucleotide adenylyltransferase [Syntrophotalea carbinolica]ABA88082.1 nicotinamide mononucleotide adenylyltransferase family protein [Syntrophotalea carbinolica DSM 2380]
MTHEPMADAETGVIHGRFQVLHNDHLAYLLAGKALCRHLVVGITNPDPFLTKTEAADPHRSSSVANPLTYFERYTMVRAALEEAGIASSHYSVVPFPVNMPELYRYYVPLDALFFLSIYDDWGRRKLAYFTSLGLATHVLREVPLTRKGLSATDVRRRMANNEPWEDLVPPAVADLMKRWGIPGRLRAMVQSS